MKLVIFSLWMFATVSAFSQSTCSSRIPRRIPVMDQDGLGTCTATTGALLLQMNLLNERGERGLDHTPSYLAMSMYSASRTSETTGFFKADPKDGSRVFFAGFDHVCNVVNTAMTQGFCDTENFPLDFLGQRDAMFSQQLSMEMIGDYLQSNMAGLELLRERFRNSPEETMSLLSYLYQRPASVCRGDPRSSIVRNVWARRRDAWRSQLARTTDAGRRRVLTTLLSRTFDASGQPTQAAMDFGMDDLFSRGMGVRNTPDHIDTIGEGMLSVHWAIRQDLDMQGFLADGVTDDAIQADHQRTKYCQWPMLMAMQEFLRNPDCPVPGDQTVPADVRLQVEALGRIFTRQDLRASVVGLMSPACANQAQRRRVRGVTCSEVNITEENEAAKKAELFSELCAGRAVGLAVCPWFMNLSGPWDSQHCSRFVDGVNRNDFHAFTAIGFRTSGTRRQVLIQNSYGTRCDFADLTGSRSSFLGLAECERNADGVTTGRFWIDEDLILNNSIQMTTLR